MMADGDVHTIRVGPRTFSYTEGTEDLGEAPFFQSDMQLSKGIVDADSVAIETVYAIPVTSIADPSTELASYAGRAAGALLVALQVGAATDVFTLYAWDAADSGGADVPYVVAGSSGFWIAIGGRYTCSDVTFCGAVLFSAGAVFNTDITVKGAEGASGIINLSADEGDDNVDKWRVVAHDGGAKLTIETYASGAWVEVLHINASNEMVVDSGVLALKETTTPSAVAGYARIYSKSDNQLYYQDGDGNEHLIHGHSYASIWFHSHTNATITIASAEIPVKVDCFVSAGLNDPSGNAVSSIVNNEIALGAAGEGLYEIYHSISTTVAGGAAKEIMSGIGVELATALDITDVTDDTVSPIVVTSIAHGLLDGDVCKIENVVGNTAANGYFIIDNKTDNTFELVNIDGTATTGNGDYDAGTPTGDVTFIYPGVAIAHTEISSTDLRTMFSSAFYELCAEDKVGVYVMNLDDANDILPVVTSLKIRRVSRL